MKKIKVSLFLLFIFLFIPSAVSAENAFWTGNNVYEPDKKDENWGLASSDIYKLENPGAVYSLTDLSSYSAYVTNCEELIGNPIGRAFKWFNKSRLAYVKLIKVTPGSDISFVFDSEYYVYCAEFNDKFTLTNDGRWFGTGDKCTLSKTTAWIVIVFRQSNGDLSDGSGKETYISSDEIMKQEPNYIVFEPFVYTFNPNGGTYENKTGKFTMERLGVGKMTMPLPVRSGYNFTGWKTAEGKIYTKALEAVYEKALFKNTEFTAQWSKKTAQSLTLNKEYVIMEQNKNEKFKIIPSILPTDVLDKSVTYSSANTSVATVDAQGTVTAKKTGKTTITAKTANGVTAALTVYVMGFDITVPASCGVNSPSQIKINVYNNGESGMTGQKRVIVDSDDVVTITRSGDEDTQYELSPQASLKEESGYTAVSDTGFIANTSKSMTIFYKLKPKLGITKAGDYEGNVNFSVSVV